MRDFLHWCADIFSHLQTLRRVTHASGVTISWVLRWRQHAGHCVILLQHQFLWVYTPISWLEPPSIWLLWTASATFSFKKCHSRPGLVPFYTNFPICIPHSLVPSSSADIHSVLLTLNLSLSDFSLFYLWGIYEVDVTSLKSLYYIFFFSIWILNHTWKYFPSCLTQFMLFYLTGI